MPQLTHEGYTFKYNENGVYPIRSHDYNFADAKCIEAMNLAIQKHMAIKDKSLREAYVYIGKGHPDFWTGRVTPQTKRYYKIGSSFEPYQRGASGVEEIIHTIKLANRKAAYEYETKLHHQFSYLRVAREWFDLTPQQLADILNQ